MPVNNMVRLKYHPDTAGNQEPGKSAIVTIVAQSYYAQYNVVFDDRPIQAVTSVEVLPDHMRADRKSTRLNSSHVSISYAVFCLKKKTDSGAHPQQQRT